MNEIEAEEGRGCFSVGCGCSLAALAFVLVIGGTGMAWEAIFGDDIEPRPPAISAAPISQTCRIKAPAWMDAPVSSVVQVERLADASIRVTWHDLGASGIGYGAPWSLHINNEILRIHRRDNTFDYIVEKVEVHVPWAPDTNVPLIDTFASDSNRDEYYQDGWKAVGFTFANTAIPKLFVDDGFTWFATFNENPSDPDSIPESRCPGAGVMSFPPVAQPVG